MNIKQQHKANNELNQDENSSPEKNNDNAIELKSIRVNSNLSISNIKDRSDEKNQANENALDSN